MAGHSKWANTKRRKAAQDSKKGKVFSLLSKELTIAARSGGGDVQFNPRLRSLLVQAKASNMPADNIERAIKKGTGQLDGQVIEELTYEAYATGGVGIIIEVTTDNKNRSATDLRTALSKNGGNLAAPGALAFTFKHVGFFSINREAIAENTLMELALNAGAQDIITQDDYYEVFCSIGDFYTLAHAFEAAKLTPESAQLIYTPVIPMTITDEDLAQKILRLIDHLEALEDVKNVFHNMELEDALIQKLNL